MQGCWDEATNKRGRKLHTFPRKGTDNHEEARKRGSVSARQRERESERARERESDSAREPEIENARARESESTRAQERERARTGGGKRYLAGNLVMVVMCMMVQVHVQQFAARDFLSQVCVCVSVSVCVALCACARVCGAIRMCTMM